MTTITQSIPSLGSPPLTTDPVNFDTRADTLYGTSLPAVITATNTWSGQANTVAGEVNTNAGNASTSAAAAVAAKTAAEAAQAAAEAASNATEWVSGQAYLEGDVVWSPITYTSYRANTNTSGTTDPSLSASWTSVVPAGGVSYLVKTANYTAKDKEGVLADTSGGAFTVTLPATPDAGDQVVIADSGNSWGTNNLTVGRNGSTIGGLAENLVCDITGASVQFVYDGSTWEVYAQIGGNSGTVVTLNDLQTLTNKTINGASNTLSVRLANDVTGTLPFANGGTGLSTLGTAGQVLTVNTGATALEYTTPAAPSVAGWTLLSTVTASASATVDVETTFDSTYNVYVIVANAVLPATDGAVLHSLLKVGGTYQTASYQYMAGHTPPTTANAVGSTVSTSDTKIIVGDGAAGSSNTSDFGSYFTMQVYNPAATDNRKIINWDGSSIRPSGNGYNLVRLTGNGVYIGGTQALTGVRFQMSTGNIASGSFRLYGIRKT